MNHNNILSVVTLTFNNYRELLKTINSLKGVDSVESVIVNGGSCIKTKDFLEKNNQYINISESDYGISDAFNKGIKLSSGKYIAFLNSGDIVIDRGYYQFAINYLSNNSHINYIYADIELNHQYMGKQIVRPSDKNGKTPFPHPSLIVERSVFDKVDFFDLTLKIAMDYDFMCRLIKGRYKGFYYKKAVVLMDGKGISSNNGLEGVNERILVLRRYDMHDLYSYYYLEKLKFKILFRKMLAKFGILNFYDWIKYSIKKDRME
jgi:glycosyltransferase involved in cell wall biosynthesis